MTRSFTAYTALENSRDAGTDLGRQLRDALPGPPDAAILFASSRFDYEALLSAFDEACHPRVLVGSSSAGEFTGQRRGEGTACALAFCSADIAVTAGLGLGVSADRRRAAQDVVGAFQGLGTPAYPHRSALVLADALAGHMDDLVEQLTVLTSGKYQFAGGGAGDDAQFSRTHVFCGTRAYSDAVVALELLSTKPLGVGVGHGWSAASRDLRVTEADGMRLVGLNGLPAVEAFEEHAEATGQAFDRSAPLPFFLHNILGIDTGAGHRLRVPLAVNADGSVTCAAEIPAGARVHIMKASADSAVAAARQATERAVNALGGREPSAALFFDCVATRLRMGDVFGFELDSVARTLGGASLVGCNTYGQIARSEGQFGGFHNCTAVVMVLPN
ncbi:MAG TPA: FIST N-terminal domain-containing protein [Vicinamibacterales bacterium]|nr:FIST N-terminal domain-containing protein [Vicinamibacterales bacterium]